MESWIFLIKGLLVGFFIAAPVGPIGILCIKRTLEGGMKAGVSTGLGAATADSLYGLVAALGITAVSECLLRQQIILHRIGGLFLLYLAWNMAKKTVIFEVKEKPSPLKGNYLSTFFLTLVNPMTILSFAAVFAGVGAGFTAKGYLLSISLVIGVFGGSALWWLLLSFAVSRIGKFLEKEHLQWINYISAAVLAFFGLEVFTQLI